MLTAGRHGGGGPITKPDDPCGNGMGGSGFGGFGGGTVGVSGVGLGGCVFFDRGVGAVSRHVVVE